jgi:Fe2+ transport system protein FeoA
MVCWPVNQLGLAPGDPHLAELVQQGLVNHQGCRLELTRQGWSAAAQAAHCRPLVELQPGQTGRVACLDAHQPAALRKLMALGVLPGNPIRLLRRSPAFVFQVGYSQFAVDESVAGAIYVRVDDERYLNKLRTPESRTRSGHIPAVHHH